MGSPGFSSAWAGLYSPTNSLTFSVSTSSMFSMAWEVIKPSWHTMMGRLTASAIRMACR